MSKRATKTQRELLNLLATPVEGYALDVVWVADNYCGVTEACQMAADRSRRSIELPALGHASSNSAWDAMRILAAESAHPGSGYWTLAYQAIQSRQKHSRNGCVFVFDNAQGFMDCSSVDLSIESATRSSKWEKVVTAFEDAQRHSGVPVRCVFFVYKATILVRRDTAGRSVNAPLSRFPRLGTRFAPRVQGWDWTRNGLVANKQRDEFSYYEQADVAAHDEVRNVKRA